MTNALIVYSSKYGQTKLIAEHIVAVINGSGEMATAVSVKDVRKAKPIAEFDTVIFGSPIYATAHSKQILKFVRQYRGVLQSKRTGFFSVSLSAAGDDSQKQDARDCMKQFFDRCEWQPNHAEIFAGSLPYRKYNWLVRWLMKRISSKAGGDTDTSRDHEYTDWQRVRNFAMRFVTQQSIQNSQKLSATTETCSSHG